MHWFNVVSVFTIVMLIGVEFSVFAFVNPAAWRLDPEPQMKLLSRFASVLGKVMPVWYPVCAVLLGVQTWLHWQATGLAALLAADALWLLASVGGLLFLVPLNSRIAAGDADWKRMSRVWDGRHRVRTAALAIAAVLLTSVVVR